MKTITAQSAFRQIASHAERIKNDEREVITMMSPGDNVRQGDLYFVFLDVEPRITGPHPRQLAPGTSQGSRHVAEGDCEVFSVDTEDAVKIVNRIVPATDGQELFIGPLVRSTAGFEATHPEHGDKVFPAGSILVVYQRSWADLIRRQVD